MARSSASKSTQIIKTVILAAASIGLYTALFMNEPAVIKYYTKGSFYAALPVLTAFVFSLVHGTFASQCLEVLGVTAKKTTSDQVEVTKTKQKDARKGGRARLNAT